MIIISRLAQRCFVLIKYITFILETITNPSAINSQMVSLSIIDGGTIMFVKILFLFGADGEMHVYTWRMCRTIYIEIKGIL